MNVLKNRTICMNNVRAYFNEIAPQIIKELEKGFSLTVNYELFKKDKERIQAIIKSKKHFRAFLKINEYSIIFNVDDNYRTCEHGCVYYKEYEYLWDLKGDKAYTFIKKKLVTLKQLEKASAELPKLREKKSDIGYKISKLEILLGA